MTGNLIEWTTKLSTLTARINGFSQQAECLLQANAKVEILQENPFSLAVKIGNLREDYTVKFPAPVLESRTMVRISRKSLWVEVIAPIADYTKEEVHQNSMSITFMARSIPQIWNMPYLSMDQLSILDISKKSELEWVNSMILSRQWSSKERVVRGE